MLLFLVTAVLAAQAPPPSAPPAQRDTAHAYLDAEAKRLPPRRGRVETIDRRSPVIGR
jgi:hypothetical protein